MSIAHIRCTDSSMYKRYVFISLEMQLLTLGAHAPEGYGSCPVCVCVSVCVCVCVSVRNLNLGTGASRGLNEGTSE